MTKYPQGDQTTSPQEQFTPSAEQLERERALRNYNRKFIYFPVFVAVAIGVILTVLMLVALFAPGPAGSLAFLSGLADTILVMWMIPMTVLCAIGPVMYIAYLVNRRQRRAELPPDSLLLKHRRSQMALWQAQNISDRIEKQTESISDRIAKPFITLDAFVQYIFAWLTILARPFRRENHYDPDGSDDPDGFS
jgi:hypothetical protein